MGRRLRYFEPDGIYFITNRCAGGRYLLTPSPEVNRIVRGALARYASRHDVELFAWVAMGNHFHLVVRSESMKVPEFMRDFQAHVSREVKRLRDGWQTSVFDERYSCQPILDDSALRAKIDYVHMNPVRAGLVRRPGEWPGVSSFDMFEEGGTREARFLNRRKLRKLERKSDDGDVDPERAMDSYRLELTLPPNLEGESPGQVHASLHEETVERARRWRDKNRLDKDGVVGPEAVRNQEPLSRPEEPPSQPEPTCLTTSKEKAEEYREHRTNVVSSYRSAMATWRDGDSDVTFPPGTRPPGWCRTKTRGDPTLDAAA